MLLLFAFIYWQTVVREQERIDGIVLGETRFVLGGLGAVVPARLDTWLTEDTHRVRYGALFAHNGARVTGNVLTRPAGLPPDGKADRAEIGPIGRDRDRDVQEIVRAVTVPLADGRLEAVGNLVNNAIKFSPAGTEVTLSVCDVPGGACIRVADQGPGIPPAEREQVLQRFYRTERSRTVEGSGLGLSLVAAVAALHGFGLRIGGADPGCIVELICIQGAGEPGESGGVPHPP